MKIDNVNDQKYFVKRLNIIDGQIKGLTKMIDDGKSYEEVLMQLGALTNSLRTVGRSILESYLKNNLKINEKEIKDFIKLYNKLV